MKNIIKYKAKDFAKQVGVLPSIVAYHCKVANKNYYKNDFEKPPHPDYVEISNFCSWFGCSRETYILPLSDHNRAFYSEDRQYERKQSRRKGKGSKVAKVYVTGLKRKYTKKAK